MSPFTLCGQSQMTLARAKPPGLPAVLSLLGTLAVPAITGAAESLAERVTQHRLMTHLKHYRREEHRVETKGAAGLTATTTRNRGDT